MIKQAAKTVRCAVYTRKSTDEKPGTGLQLARRAAGSGRELYCQPKTRRLDMPEKPLRRTAVLAAGQ